MNNITDTQHCPATIKPCVDPRTEIRHVLRVMLDKVFYVIISLGLLALAASTYRSTLYGWHASYFADAVVFLSIAVILLFRRHLPQTLVCWAIAGLTAIDGLISLVSLGLASAGMLIMASVCMLLGVFCGLKAGLICVGLSALAIAGVGVATILGVLPPLHDVVAFIQAPSTWLTQLLAFTTFCLAVIVTTNSIQRRLAHSLKDVAQRTHELDGVIRQLSQSEREYRLLAENISDVVFILDVDLHVQYISPSIQRLSGFSVAEAQPREMKEWLAPHSLQQLTDVRQRYVAAARQGPIDIPLEEFEFIRKDGTTFWGEVRIKVLYSDSGEVIGSQGVLRDVSERKHTEKERLKLIEELRQAEKMRAIGQLAGGIAHDVNNQLVAILGFADIIFQNEALPEEIRECARNIHLAAEQSADLTNKLLTFARRGKSQSVPVDLHSILNQVIVVLQRSIDKRISIRQSLQAGRHAVQGDPSQLSNAFLNLGLNARDAMPQGGEIVFSTTVTQTVPETSGGIADADSSAPLLECCVCDTGIGMDRDTLQHIFEPFFTTKEPGKGTGLGLATVYGIVKDHNGTISVESRPGTGTTFRLRLPLTDAIPASTAKAAQQPKPLPRTGTIMVVDDEKLVCKMATMLLQRAGFKVHTFFDPAAACDFYRENWQTLQLALVDMVMPVINGKELAARLHAVSPTVPILLSSGNNNRTAAQDLQHIGVAGFIQKPYTSAELYGKIDEILQGLTPPPTAS
jgi:PAS domain S-box-containing protein